MQRYHATSVLSLTARVLINAGFGRMSASLIGRLGSSTFRLSSTPVLMSLTGSRFSSDSALGPFRILPKGLMPPTLYLELLGIGRVQGFCAVPGGIGEGGAVRSTRRSVIVHAPAAFT